MISNRPSVFFLLQTSPSSTERAKGARSQVIDDIKNISVNEELNGIPNASITLDDPNLIYARTFKREVQFILTYGYKEPDTSVESILENIRNPGLNLLVRGNMRFLVTEISTTGDESGFTTTFSGVAYYTNRRSEKHTGNLRAIINRVLLRMGATGTLNFMELENIYNSKCPLVQEDVTDYRFLRDIATKFGLNFYYVLNPAGFPEVTMVDPGEMETMSTPQKFLTRGRIILNFSGGTKNVLSYEMAQESGAGGSGDRARLTMINGNVFPIQQRLQGETFVDWQIDSDKIKREIERLEAQENGFSKVIDFVAEITNASNFDQVREYWKPGKISTAPASVGYNVSVEMSSGAPLIVPGTRAIFGTGFPDRLITGVKRGFFIQSVSHTIDSENFITNLEIKDTNLFIGRTAIGSV